ncbi:xylose isomerase [Synchytrium endobioticum]|uniref:Xylose isomerase n=1 Tax=Synchytrium endobioticum TaxID=286115 RepID=A0A507CZF1_9FUNG|nr:xylose isomerase [Synchytrium endobioticum]
MAKTYFPSVTEKVSYGGSKSTNPMEFRWYNPILTDHPSNVIKDEIVYGCKMRDHLKFAACFWHTFRWPGVDPFGVGAFNRPWQVIDPVDQTREQALAAAKQRVDAAFEFFVKLGVDYYTFHDRDVCPEGSSLEETNAMLDNVTDYMLQKQKQTGVKLLWGTANLFSHPRYKDGAMTSPDMQIFAHAAAQVKKAMEVTHKLGGEGYVFWGGREGYQTILNTDIKREIQHMAAFLRMVIQHKKDIGATFHMFIEPKPREPTKHQYDYDAQTVLHFLYANNLQDDFSLNIEPNHTTLAGHNYEHDVVLSAALGKLGSIDCNSGDPLLGWDTDQFLTNEKEATLVVKAVLQMGGLKGGFNFDCKVRRESTDLEDLFIAHIGAMDIFARGLRNAAKILEYGRLPKMVSHRYSSWDSSMGGRIESGQSSLSELSKLAECSHFEKITVPSSQAELYDRVLNEEIWSSVFKDASPS